MPPCWEHDYKRSKRTCSGPCTFNCHFGVLSFGFKMVAVQDRFKTKPFDVVSTGARSMVGECLMTLCLMT